MVKTSLRTTAVQRGRVERRFPLPCLLRQIHRAARHPSGSLELSGTCQGEGLRVQHPVLRSRMRLAQSGLPFPSRLVTL